METPTASSSASSANSPIAAARPASRRRSARVTEGLATAAVVVTASAIFGVLFYRETALSYSIGYNLYGATRILKGEVPYRNFHTLYPPATVYLNALLFKFFGAKLYVALLGVGVFKVLTMTVIYRCARRVMSLSAALAASAFSIVWLRPNGPFKAVPMHYGSLFLALALLMVFNYIDRKKLIYLVLAGISTGVLALFKHNIGAYAFIGLGLSLIFHGNPLSLKPDSPRNFWRPILAMTAGAAAPVLPVLAYMRYQGALLAMARTLLFGPGEFLASRLAAAPSALYPLGLTLVISIFVWWLYRSGTSPGARTILTGLAALLLIALVLLVPEGPINELVFYIPVLAVISGLIACRLFASDETVGPHLYAIVAVTAAAFMEAFPRFAREQSIAAMPYVGLLLLAMVNAFKEPIERRAGSKTAGQIVAYALPVMLFALGGRFFYQTFFERGLHLKSTTPLTTSRGEGVCFPADSAHQIDAVVSAAQQAVPEGGYVFAQSYAGSSYLFLADRLNPSGAQFWGGVGVSKAEREQTLQSVQEKNVQLVITSDRDIAAERYKPMNEFLEKNFTPAAQFGEVILMRRTTPPSLSEKTAKPLDR